MRSAFYTLFLLFVGLQTVFGQSPAEFLGYQPGDRFTYHHRIADYVRFLAGKYNDRVHLIEYGKTYEGRPLMAAVLSSPENLSRLEELRKEHLAGIGMSDTQPGKLPAPAIAWLSYGVHGDEGSSSEAAMGMMYFLLEEDKGNLLENLIVILEPCLNPDGHSRYVNWYNQVVGLRPDLSPHAREHSQPWPGGRFNHYLSDLNRDWAWQVQKESQQRLKLYHRWMPHLHADFHEMGSGSSYYFPPAAKPFHEEVTSWQREFNSIVGEYNRKYFDANHWLYFTKTSYDLFYPGYGDTWPTFHGAIGITYEQGGGGRAGLALARSGEGDTLTLRTRIVHHLAAGKATLEALAANKEKMISEFRSFFRKAREKPVGNYQTYIIKVNGEETRLKPFTQLLERQNISFGRLGKGFTAQATDFLSNETGKVAFAAGDVLISAYQPGSHFLKVLLESNPFLEDSLTYDITSWGLGYVFGFSVYGLEQKKEAGAYEASPHSAKVFPEKPYAYLVKWNGTAELRLLADLLSEKVKVRTAESSFETDGEVFPPGALIITRGGNEGLGDRYDSLVTGLAKKHEVELFPTGTGMVARGQDFGSAQVLRPLRVALLGGNGVSPGAFGEVWHFFDQDLKYPLTLLDHLSSQSLENLDVLILADGNYKTVLEDNRLPLLTEWVNRGGKLIALERSMDQLVGKKGFNLKRKSVDRQGAGDLLKTYGGRQRQAIRDKSAGAVYEVMLDRSHPLGYGYEGRSYYSSVRNIYDLEYLSEGWNVGYFDNNSYRSGFVGDRAGNRLKNTLVLGVQESGSGRIIYIADSPLFRGFWENGKLLFGNAIFR